LKKRGEGETFRRNSKARESALVNLPFPGGETTFNLSRGEKKGGKEGEGSSKSQESNTHREGVHFTKGKFFLSHLRGGEGKKGVDSLFKSEGKKNVLRLIEHNTNGVLREKRISISPYVGWGEKKEITQLQESGREKFSAI